MNKKILIFIVIILILIIFMVFISSDYSSNRDDSNKTILNVSSEGPFEISKIIFEIKTEDYYNGYDNETVEWMESLGNKALFFSSNEIIIMDKHEADKIPSIFACDAMFYEIFSCDVLENHSLGNTTYHKDVLFVKNVEYIKEEVEYFEV